MLSVMPQHVKPKQKQKIKPKAKAKPEPPSFTAKKSYWVTLMLLFAVVTAVFGATMGFGLAKTAVLTVTVVLLIGLVGYLRVNPSTLSLSKRATFVFVGVSVIGFGIWAVIAIAVMPQVPAFRDDFFVVTSFAICLAAGAFIGELLGRNKRLQEWLFPQKL